MIPQVIVTDRLELPVLLEVLRAKTRLTLRVYEEVVEGDAISRRGRISGRYTLEAPSPSVTGKQARKKTVTPRLSAPAAIVPGDQLSRPGRDFLMLDEMLFDLTAKGELGKEWSDHANWVFPMNPDGSLDIPFNRFTASWLAKSQDGRIRLQANNSYPLRLMVPFKTSPLSDCSLVINAHPELGWTGNVEATWTLPADIVAFPREMVLPSIKLTGPASIVPDGSAAIAVEILDKDGAIIADAACEVLLESVSGYLPMTREAIVGGTGSFKIIALGLEAGDAVRIKAGLGLFTGLADITIPVV